MAAAGFKNFGSSRRSRPVSTGTHSLPDLRDSLIEQVEKRFNDVLDSGGSESDPLWLASATLDPRSLRFLTDDKIDAPKSASPWLKSSSVEP